MKSSTDTYLVWGLYSDSKVGCQLQVESAYFNIITDESVLMDEFRLNVRADE